jgi:hypothetical protein
MTYGTYGQVLTMPPKLHKERYYCGLDVAQQHDFTALAILERVNGEVRLVHLDRWMLHYPDTLARLGVIFSDPQAALARKSRLVVDATGPGLSFYEDMRRDPILRRTVYDQRIVPMVIRPNTEAPHKSGRFWHIPKHYLITRLQSALRRHQIKVPVGLPLMDVLERELEGYELKVKDTGYVTYSNNPRDGGPEHDDTILALAMAWWSITAKLPQTALRLVG